MQGRGRESERDARLTESGGANCGFYLRRERNLIRRHIESVSFDVDDNATWALRIDFELPHSDEPGFKDGEGDEHLYLFPLVFLKKNEARINFNVQDVGGTPVPIPTRTETDAISIAAAGQAIEQLVERAPDIKDDIDLNKIDSALEAIPSAKAFLASLAMADLEQTLGLAAIEAGSKPNESWRELGERMRSSGLLETLEMMVEHSLLWVTLRGRPSERRSVVVSQEMVLEKPSLMRWSFGAIPAPLPPGRRITANPLRLWRQTFGRRPSQPMLTVGSQQYGCRDQRISFAGFGERIGQQLGWVPFEFELPTIYTKRCRSYHFEVRAAPGRTPRNLQASYDSPPQIQGELGRGRQPKKITRQEGRITLTQQAARLDLPRKATGGVAARFRVVIGIGDGAFPFLWFFAAALTAVMLWVLADWQPSEGPEQAQILATILLIVPALIAALAVGSNEVPISRLLGAARILVLTAGLSAAAAASALAGAEPFNMKPEWGWTAYAITATAAAVPLAAAWLLSHPMAWQALMKLDSHWRQEGALVFGILAALALSSALIWIEKGLVARTVLAIALLTLAVVMSVVASDRGAIPMTTGGSSITISFLIAGFACLALGCIELCAAVGDHATRLQEWAERGAVALLLLASVSHELIAGLSSLGKPRPDEVHVTPHEGLALLYEESVGPLLTLFERERRAGLR